MGGVAEFFVDEDQGSDLAVQTREHGALPKTLELEQRRVQVWEMRTRGVPVTAIAGALGVSESTVYADLTALADQYREQVIERSGIDLVSETLQWYEELERIALFELQSAEKISTVDERTGQVVKVTDPMRAKFLQLALKARDSKTKLLMDTGIIPREPHKLMHHIRQEVAIDHRVTHDVRSDEEVRDSIEKLLRRTRRITEPVTTDAVVG